MVKIGADIHCHVECYNDATNEWEEVLIRNPYNITHDYDEATDTIGEPYCNFISPYDCRSYVLFGILAGVRSNVFKQIDDPRGLPKDVSPTVAAEYRKYEDDWHTPSWYTLKELRDWDKKKNFALPNYGDPIAKKYAKAESKDMRYTFRYFTNSIEFMANLKDPFVNDNKVRVVFWFDS